MAYFHLSESYIKFNNVTNPNRFVRELNRIPYFDLFFEFGEFDETVTEGDRYELYDNSYSTNLSYKQTDLILDIVKSMIELCEAYDQELSLTLKFIDDGDYMLYLIVINNKLVDIANLVNDKIANIERKTKQTLQ